jgi:hypothetical protein
MDPENLDSILVLLQHATANGSSSGPLARGRRLPADTVNPARTPALDAPC